MLCRVPRSLPTHVLLMLSRDTQPSKSITVPARSARLAYMMFALFFVPATCAFGQIVSSGEVFDHELLREQERNRVLKQQFERSANVHLQTELDKQGSTELGRV
jgi:hypothetical protein